MNLGRQSFSSALVAVAAAIVLLGTLYFASFRPGYSHIPNTISELGETGAPQAHWVAFGFFLPVGIIVWWALWLVQRHRSGSRDTSLVLLALSGLGTGYVLAAFFPCDPGGPLFGSWRTLVHNAAGLIDYGGTALGFLLFCRHCARQQMRPQAVAFGIAAALGFFALVLLALPPAFPVRGAVQRVTELIQFTGVFFVCRLLSTRAAPNTQPADSTVPGTSDRECLESWAHHRDAGSLQTLVERSLVFVHSSALRRTGDAAQAAEVTRAVFLVLARRARRLRKKTVLAGWLFHVTAVACRKLRRMGRLQRFWQWISRKSRPALLPDATLWTRLAPQMDRALERLRTRQRNAVLLCAFLNHDFASAAKVLRTSERRVEKRVGRGMKRLAKRLGKRRAPVDPSALASACATEGCAATLPASLSLEILQSMEASGGKRPSLKLARRTLNTLAWARWRRRFVIGTAAVAALITILGGSAVYIDSFSGYSRLRSEAILWRVRFRGWQVAELARPWPTNAATPRLDAGSVRNAQDLYGTTNIWLSHLSFTREQWKALELKRIGPMPNSIRPAGMHFLRNPQARRSGVAGVLGFEFDWTHADFELGGVVFTNVAARVKGNLRSLYEPNRAYKVDLNKFAPGQKLGGLDELTFNSLLWEYSGLAEALGFEFFREAGVPAPRTAYAWLSVSVTTQWDQRPLGLYLMVEAVDDEFAAERFGSKATPLFKPVTHTLFEHLGDEWSAYAPIYDLKTKATPEQQRRVIDFARLVSSGTDAEFAARVGDFLDLDEFARFLSGQVLLPSYDGILSAGQNYYMYLDPRSNKFGFIPWDLNSAWGNIWIASKAEQARASIWHPWLGENRFIERVMAVEEFRRIYRSHLEDFLSRLFVPERLHQRIDEIAAVIREPIAAQSAFLLDKFEQAVGLKPVHPSPGENPDNNFNRPAYEIKRFIDKRAESVRRQLDGKSRGMILKFPEKR